MVFSEFESGDTSSLYAEIQAKLYYYIDGRHRDFEERV
jgi:hypothetical protein